MLELQFGKENISDGYNMSQVEYQWTRGGGVNISTDMKLPQFDLISSTISNETVTFNKGQYHYKLRTFSILTFLESHSSLMVSFHLQRHMGDFIIQVYGPCILIVVISWVPFWLNREATSDRITLGERFSLRGF